MKKIITLVSGLFLLLLFAIPQNSLAQDFVYQPVNPAFGGSPLNYSWLLSSANAQNLYQGDTGFDFDRDPLENFEERLQRQLLFSLTQEIINKRFGDVNIKKQSSFKIGNFSIEFFRVPAALI